MLYHIVGHHKKMTSFRFHYSRYIRPTLLWVLFFLIVYWCNVKDIKQLQLRKLNRLNKLEIVKRKSLVGSEERTLSYITIPKSVNKYNTHEYMNSKKEENKRNTFWKNGTTNRTNLSIDIEDLSLVIVNHEPAVETEYLNNGKGRSLELETSLPAIADTNNPRLTSDGDDLLEKNIDDGRSENTRMKRTPQSVLIVAALREQITNEVVLKHGRLHWTIGMAGGYPDKLFSPPPKEVPKQRFPKVVSELPIPLAKLKEGNAIIIGFGKCGTRALIDFLSMHPNIVTTGPEIHFFDVDENFNKGMNWYRAQMPVSYSNQITLEKTPSYIWSERAMEEIYKLDRHMKLIVIMKDPVTRIVSQAVRSGPDIPSVCMVFKDGQLQVNNESRTVQWSIYVRYLQTWMKKFSKYQIHVLETSEFAKEPAKELQRIEAFLGIPKMITESNFYFNETKGFYCARPFHVNDICCLPEGKSRRHPELHPFVGKKLYEFFRGHNENLFRLLGRKFQWEPRTLSAPLPMKEH